MSTNTSMLDLVSIIERYAPTRLQRVSNANGGEWAGPCVWCGGRDRMRVWPNAEKPHLWCRGCLKRGDTLDFIMEYLFVGYREACEELGIEPGEEYTVPSRPLAGDEPPSKSWQDMAGLIVEKAERYLWTPSGKPAMDYLRSRGLNDDIIKQARLGYFPTDSQGKWYSRPFSDWGLNPELLTPDQQKKGCVRVLDGIIIPWFAGGNLWKLTVKRFQAADGELKYGQILGSRECLFNADSIQPGQQVLVCEAVLDALSAKREVADLISCVAVDGVKSCRLGRWIAQLAQTSLALIAFDNDDNKAGDKEAEYWIDVLPKAMRWAPLSHDVNQMLQANQDIHHWVQMGLSIATTPTMPLEASVQTEPLIVPSSIQELVSAFAQPQNDDFSEWLASLETVTKDKIDSCTNCINGAEYYTGEGVPYCASCWQALQKSTKARLPHWLVPGTWEWNKQIERCGLTEMMERRNIGLEQLKHTIS